MAVENLPAGFRFHPTDEELISYYLMRKVSDTNFSCKAVAVVDLNKCEPWDLPGKATMGEKEWYFFSMKDRKYPTGLRTNRATESGYWKTTGKDKEIYSSGGGGVLIGMKKTLVFYKGRAPRGNKTNWVIHEYRLQNNNHHHHPFKSSKEEWVVCRVFQKSTAPKRSSPQVSQEYQEYSPPCNNETSVFNEEYGADADEFPNIANSSTAAAFNTVMMNHSPSLFPPWPSGILNNPTINNLSMNSLLLKALQLRTYQQAAAAANNNTHHFAAYNNNNNDNDIDCIPQGFSSHHTLGTTDFISSNLNNNNVVSGSRVLECMSEQQEQPPLFNTASFGGEVV